SKVEQGGASWGGEQGWWKQGGAGRLGGEYLGFYDGGRTGGMASRLCWWGARWSKVEQAGEGSKVGGSKVEQVGWAGNTWAFTTEGEPEGWRRGYVGGEQGGARWSKLGRGARLVEARWSR